MPGSATQSSSPSSLVKIRAVITADAFDAFSMMLIPEYCKLFDLAMTKRLTAHVRIYQSRIKHSEYSEKCDKSNRAIDR